MKGGSFRDIKKDDDLKEPNNYSTFYSGDPVSLIRIDLSRK
jgi:hypothetical protein